MRIENGQVKGDISLEDHLAIYGQVIGNLNVINGGVLHLYGVCTGDVSIQVESKAVIYGMVNGNVTNNGGDLQVLGTINGSLKTILGNSEIDLLASIHNKIR